MVLQQGSVERVNVEEDVVVGPLPGLEVLNGFQRVTLLIPAVLPLV